MAGTISADRNRCSDQIFGGIGFIGLYKNGIPTGHCWKELMGKSYLYGKVNSEGQFSGKMD